MYICHLYYKLVYIFFCFMSSQVFKKRVDELHEAIEKNRQRKPSPIQHLASSTTSSTHKKSNKVRRRSEEKSSASALMVTSANYESGNSVPVWIKTWKFTLTNFSSVKSTVSLRNFHTFLTQHSVEIMGFSPVWFLREINFDDYDFKFSHFVK